MAFGTCEKLSGFSTFKFYPFKISLQITKSEI